MYCSYLMFSYCLTFDNLFYFNDLNNTEKILLIKRLIYQIIINVKFKDIVLLFDKNIKNKLSDKGEIFNRC